LHDLDTSGQTFRYSTVKEKGPDGRKRRVPARPDEKSFDLVATAAALSGAGNLILNGVSGVLDSYLEYLSDLAADVGNPY
jgi:hypothetical protein